MFKKKPALGLKDYSIFIIEALIFELFKILLGLVDVKDPLLILVKYIPSSILTYSEL